MPDDSPSATQPALSAVALGRVVTALGAAAPELDATALAEAIWLASRMVPAVPGPSASGGTVSGAAAKAHLPPPSDPRALTGEDPVSRDRPTEAGDQGARSLHERLPGSSGRVTGHAVAVPGASALSSALELTRALRAWKRPWRAGRRYALDLDATVDGYARSGELIPAFAPAPERWFDLMLVVDRSPSMQVWRETVDALTGLLDRLGAFRTLQVRDLGLDSGIELTDRQGQPTSPGQLGSPDGRRLVIVVSDCTAAAWREPEIWQQLRDWAQREPVALLSPLPPKLWRRTGLDLPTARASLDVPGAPNTGFTFRLPPLLAHGAERVDSTGRDDWLALPVLSLSPNSLGRWSRAVMRAAPDGCSVALIPPGGRLRPFGAARPMMRRTPEERTEGFLRTAAPAAARLAALSSAFDRLSLHLLHVLRNELVPDATTEDLAELLGSGLYTLNTDPSGRVVLQLGPRVRERLEQALTEHEVLLLSQVLSRHISSGRDSGGRLPAVAGGADGTEELAAEATPSGMALVRTLELLGLPTRTPPHGTAPPERTGTAEPSSTTDHALRLALAFLPQGRAARHQEVDHAMDVVVSMLAEQGLAADRSELRKQLEAAVSQFVPAAVLDDARGHVPWFRNGDFARELRFWDRYQTFLDRGQALPPGGSPQLDRVTDDILSRLEDPARPGPWSRSGLVITPIDTGKNMTVIGLAAKAIDSGYRRIVILAGTTNTERAQMQRQVDEGLLGFDSRNRSVLSEDDVRYIGAGAMVDSRRLDILSLTDSTEYGDFTPAMGLRLVPGREEPLPQVCVIKKNARIVSALCQWLEARASSTGRPLLIIDTSNSGMGRERTSGAVDGRVHRLLSTSSRTGYVSCTYAPVLPLPDLIPDFVYSIRPPLNPFDLEGQPSPVREVLDEQPWLPSRHRSDHVPSRELPESLSSAIDAFILACAVRRLRGHVGAHNSMLVSVSRFVAVQTQVRELLAKRLEAIVEGFRAPGSPEARRMMARFEQLWRTDFVPTSKAFPAANQQAVSWDEVPGHLAAAVSTIIVISVNGSSDTMTPWNEYPHSGLSVVAVGGVKLRQGASLEGLTVGYFLRSSSPHEPLHQLSMSPGNRTGYEDLCRLYATPEVLDAHERLTAVIDAQREEIEDLVERGAGPAQAVLPTSREMASFSGTSWEVAASGEPHEPVLARSDGLSERMVTVGTSTPLEPGSVQGAGILLTPRLVLTCAQGAATAGAEHWLIHGRATVRGRRVWSSEGSGPGVALLMAEEHVIDAATWADRVPTRLRWAAPTGRRQMPVRIHAHSEVSDPVTLGGDIDLEWRLPVVEVTEPHPATGWPQLSGAAVSYDDALVGFVVGHYREPQRLLTLTARALIADRAFRTALTRYLRTPYELEEIGPAQAAVPASVCLAIEVRAYSRAQLPIGPREVDRAVAGILTTLVSQAHVDGTVTETPAAGSPDLMVVIEGASALLGTGRLLAALPDALASYNEGLQDLVITLRIAASAGETAPAAGEARRLARQAFLGGFRRAVQGSDYLFFAVSEPFRRRVAELVEPAEQGQFAPLDSDSADRAGGWLYTGSPARLGEAIVASAEAEDDVTGRRPWQSRSSSTESHEEGGADAAAPVAAVYRSVQQHLRSALPVTYRDAFRRDADRLLLALLAFAAGFIDGVEQADSEMALVNAVQDFLVDRGIPAERDMARDDIVWSSEAGLFEIRVARDGAARSWNPEPSVSFELVLDREVRAEVSDLVDCVSIMNAAVFADGEKSCLVTMRLPVPDHHTHDSETAIEAAGREAKHPSLDISGFRQDTMAGAVESACEQLLGDSVGNGSTDEAMDSSWTLNGVALPPGLTGLSIQDITPNMDSISWDIVEEYEYGLVLGQLTVDAELVLEGCMLKSDYYISAYDVSLVGDVNEHMVEVTVQRNAQLRFFTRQDMNEIELEFGGTTAAESDPHDPM
ncbi:SAV_2336 N-terminal domain-related protein [Streptomyces sp. bgisy091]|uniref:SAV_2336 N-terminal domain-related protein n=1 Tax=Streptomyces sp. bgisy091 TaxID=3413778 RepID=UPI003D713B88